MKLLLLSVSCFLFNYGFSQVPAFPDSTFNGTGRKVFSLGTNVLNYGDNVSLQPDGKIIMTGATFDGGLGGLTKLGVCRLLPDGSYDPDFGVGGISKVDLGTLGYNGGFEPEIAIQSDGSMFINGFTQDGVGTGDDMLVCKLLANGNLDPAFGTGGKVWVDLFGGGSPDVAYSITTDALGNVYACGSTRNGPTPVSNDLAIIKLLPSGALDPAFSGDGKLLLDVSGTWDFGYGIHVRTDGKIVVGGYAGIPANFFAIRLLPNGSYDPTFSSDGKVFVDIFGQNVADEVWGMSVDPDGKILLVGDGIDNSAGSIPKGAVVRLTPDGELDTSFDTDGIATFSYSSTYTVLRSITRMADGRYVAAGEAAVNMDKDFYIVRLLNNGSLDVSFNNTGQYAIDLTGQGNEDFGYGLFVQPDSKILVSGNTQINEFSNQKYSIARIMSPGVLANFTASSNLICSGAQVQFSNNSQGDNLSYLWNFEGGTPGTSTDENPLITYSNAGIFDVKLIVYNIDYSDTLLIDNMIEVITTPVAPASPSGSTSTCNLQTYQYSISPVAYATSYLWSVTPSNAGVLTPNGTTATLIAAPTWTGPYTISVKAANQCGNSPSGFLDCLLNHMPVTYMISGNNYFCEGSAGTSILLENSEIGVNYELYLDGSPSGNILSGTGSSLSWNDLTTAGFYTVIGSTPNCTQQMAGQIYVEMLIPPVQLVPPSGSSITCNNESSGYSAIGAVASDNIVWTLLPANAGILVPNGNQITIDWDNSFSGNALLSVHAENACGQGLESEALSIDVNSAPNPSISGLQLVCSGWSRNYETTNNQGSSFEWVVTGGEVVSGNGTSLVTIHWTTVGAASIFVTETNSDGCVASAPSFNVLVDVCIGVDNLAAKESSYIFPNPSAGNISLVLKHAASANCRLTICDLSGRQLLELPVVEGACALHGIDISDLDCGIYVLTVFDGKATSYQIKLLKE